MKSAGCPARPSDQRGPLTRRPERPAPPAREATGLTVHHTDRDDGRASQADPVADGSPQAGSVTAGLRGALELAGVVATPAAVTGGLAYYIGYVRQRELVAYFGLNMSTLDMSTQDLVLRSTSALIPFLVGFCVVALVVIGLQALVTIWLRGRSLRVARVVVLASGALGVTGVGVGMWRLAHPVPATGLYLVWPAALALGAVLVGHAVRQTAQLTVAASRPRHGLHVLVAAVVATLALTGVFWAANDYAVVQGYDTGRRLAGNLAVLPGVVVYSDRALHLDVPGVDQQVLTLADGTRQFRYRGLRLFIRSNGRHFLLSHLWSSPDGVVVALPDGDSIRIEYTVGG